MPGQEQAKKQRPSKEVLRWGLPANPQWSKPHWGTDMGSRWHYYLPKRTLTLTAPRLDKPSRLGQSETPVFVPCSVIRDELRGDEGPSVSVLRLRTPGSFSLWDFQLPASWPASCLSTGFVHQCLIGRIGIVLRRAARLLAASKHMSIAGTAFTVHARALTLPDWGTNPSS